jgi:cytochrome c5
LPDDEDRMSDAHHSSTPHDPSHDEAHEGPIKTPKQLIVTVIASFAVPIAIIVLLVNYVDFSTRSGAGGTGQGAEAVAARLQPVGRITLRDASGPVVVRTGEEVYKAVCSACHAAGAAGAPKSGDADAWAPRIKTGYDALLGSALAGKGAIPKQGGGEFSDYEIGRAVVHMANQAGGKFDEPKAPAAAASAASAPAAASAPN